MKLFQNPDGANAQARAVLAYLSDHDGIESSWDEKYLSYRADPLVARWHNCREQGYVVSLRSRNSGRQLNIAWFEHRNSDEICAWLWEQHTIYSNPPTIETMEPKRASKWDSDHTVKVGEASDMADWIFAKLTEFWDATANEPSLGDRLRARVAQPPTDAA